MVYPSLLPEYNAMSIKQAAEKAINLGKQLQAVIDVGEVLDQIGNLEMATAEAKSIIEKANIDRQQAEASLVQVNDKLSTALTDVKNAKESAIRILDDVNRTREQLLGQTREKNKKYIY